MRATPVELVCRFVGVVLWMVLYLPSTVLWVVLVFYTKKSGENDAWFVDALSKAINTHSLLERFLQIGQTQRDRETSLCFYLTNLEKVFHPVFLEIKLVLRDGRF